MNHLFNPNTIVLFELLDFNKQIIDDGSEKLDANLNYRIAWGYLKFMGLARNHFGISKIQLYRYKFRSDNNNSNHLKNNYRRVPFVYYEFIWPKKVINYLKVLINIF